MPRHTPGRRRRILTRDKWICRYCGTDLSKWPLRKRGKDGMGGHIHIDHVTPVAQGGTHADDNLATACRGCNLTKGDRRPEDYARDEDMEDTRYDPSRAHQSRRSPGGAGQAGMAD